MLLSIETKRRGQGEEDAIGLLVACHARIRSFTGTALRLSQAVGAEPSEVADVAAAVHRYFTVALPLHVEDEDLSLAERLRPVATGPVLADLATLAAEHREIEALLEQLVPRWRALMSEPMSLGELSASLAKDTERLDHLFRGHLAVEEDRLFPAVRALMSATEQMSLAKDIRDRRARAMSPALVDERSP